MSAVLESIEEGEKEEGTDDCLSNVRFLELVVDEELGGVSMEDFELSLDAEVDESILALCTVPACLDDCGGTSCFGHHLVLHAFPCYGI